MANDETNWDAVPDEELTESLLERVEGLKEMFPEKLRNGASATVDWSRWIAANTFSMTKTAVWVISTSAMIMLMPFLIEKELHDVEQSQVKQQQQMLLSSMPDPMKKR